MQAQCSKLSIDAARLTVLSAEYSPGLAMDPTSFQPALFLVVSTSGVGWAAGEDEQDGYGASRCDAKRLGGVSDKRGEASGDVPTI
jgi:hypothetical protein